MDPLAATVQAHLEEEAGVPVMVHAVTPLTGGACQDNFRVDAWFGAGPMAGERRFAMRCDAARSLPGSLHRAREHDVINAAVAAGVKTPAARWLAEGIPQPGRFATFLDWVEGDAIGRKIVSSPALEQARAALPEQLAASLAAVHTITPVTHPDLLPVPADPVAFGLAFVRRTLDAMAEARPALELAYGWLVRSAPHSSEITLVHGDFRTGNFLVRPDGLSAVLDWEFAHFGCPEEDLAWIAVRDWRFGRLDRPIGGFADREPFYAAYERHSGRAVDREAVHFWEVLGNVRWAAGCVHQGERYLAGERDIELLAIARRAPEMEWEALRLIRKGA